LLDQKVLLNHMLIKLVTSSVCPAWQMFPLIHPIRA